MKFIKKVLKLLGLLLIIISTPLLLFFLWHIVLAFYYVFTNRASDGTALGIAIGVPGSIICGATLYLGYSLFKKTD